MNLKFKQIDPPDSSFRVHVARIAGLESEAYTVSVYFDQGLTAQHVLQLKSHPLLNGKQELIKHFRIEIAESLESLPKSRPAIEGLAKEISSMICRVPQLQGLEIAIR